MIYFINMQSLTQTNVFFTLVLRSHLQDTNVPHVSQPGEQQVWCITGEPPDWTTVAILCSTLNNTLNFWGDVDSYQCIRSILWFFFTLYDGETLCRVHIVHVMIKEIMKQGRTASVLRRVSVQWVSSQCPDIIGHWVRHQPCLFLADIHTAPFKRWCGQQRPYVWMTAT